MEIVCSGKQLYTYDMGFFLLWLRYFFFTSLAHCVLETAVKDAEEVGGFIFACLANLALECADFKCGNIF